MARDPPTPGSRDDRVLGMPRWAAALLPVVLLAVVAGAFVATDPLAGLGGEPLPSVDVTDHRLPEDEIVLSVTNNGPEAVTIAQVLVDEAYWNFEVLQDGRHDPTLSPRDSAQVVIPYHWQPGWDLETALILEDGTTVHHEIPAPQETPGFGLGLLATLAAVGLIVGVVPVALGMLWYPLMEKASDRAIHGIIAFAGGILAFLAADASFEAFEIAEDVAGYMEGEILVVVGILGALLLVQAVSAWTRERTGATHRGLAVAYLVAVGIGLHNLGEGLAIGSAYAQGRAALGGFLILGFTVHNLTEGPAVVAPVAETERPSLAHFAALGLIAGVPVIPGGWLGGLAWSPALGVLALAIGVGAILQVEWELAGLVRGDGDQVATAWNLLAFGLGLVVMYATDLLVAF